LSAAEDLAASTFTQPTIERKDKSVISLIHLNM